MDYDDFLQALRETQHNQCGVCGLDLAGRGVVDHDHRSGMVRGILCKGCNTREARHDECDDWTACPVCSWRCRPATSWLGVTMLYVSTFANSPTWVPGRIGKSDEFYPTEVTAPAFAAAERERGRQRAALIAAAFAGA